MSVMGRLNNISNNLSLKSLKTLVKKGSKQRRIDIWRVHVVFFIEGVIYDDIAGFECSLVINCHACMFLVVLVRESVNKFLTKIFLYHGLV